MKKIKLETKDLNWIKKIMNILNQEFQGNDESVFAEDDKGNRFIIQVLENNVYLEILLNKSFFDI